MLHSQHNRVTLGFLNCAIFHSDMQLMWSGAHDVARERQANLIFFNGGVLQDPRGFQAQANVVYDLVNPERLDRADRFEIRSHIPEAPRNWILAAVEKLAYRPNAAAKSLRMRQSQIIGFVTDVIATIPLTFFYELLMIDVRTFETLSHLDTRITNP